MRHGSQLDVRLIWTVNRDSVRMIGCLEREREFVCFALCSFVVLLDIYHWVLWAVQNSGPLNPYFYFEGRGFIMCAPTRPSNLGMLKLLMGRRRPWERVF